MFRRPTRPLLAIASIALLVAACGGAASPSPAATVPSAPAGTPSAGAPSPAAPSPAAPSSTASEAPGASLDLSGAAQATENLTSYELDVSMTGAVPGASADQTVTMKALIDAKQKAVEFTMSGMAGASGPAMKVIVIGDDAWVDLGTGSYIEQPGGSATYGTLFDSLAPEKLVQTIPAVALIGAGRVGDEDVNGVATTHYHMDGSNPQVAAGVGADGTIDLWIAKDGGYLVRTEVKGEVDQNGTKAPFEMSMDISRINDPSIDIQPPS